MKISKDGIELIKKFEGFMSKPYLCTGKVLTIGYGHTGPDVTPNMHLTQEMAEELLMEDIEEFEDYVNALVNPDVKLNQHQFDALVSLTYNIGPKAFGRSSVLKFLNQGDYINAAKHFPDYNRSDGRVTRGLVERRILEQKLFLS